MRATRALYAATLDLKGADVVVLGAGAVALRKLRGLPRGLKRVRIVAPEISPAVLSWMRGRSEASAARRAFRREDLKGCRLLFCCADSPEVNTRAARVARARGVWVCQAAAPEEGDLLVPAVAKAGALSMTLSTGGASPALAKALRAHFEARLRASDLPWILSRLAARRSALKADPESKARLLSCLGKTATLVAILAPRSEAGRRRLRALVKL